MTKRAQAISAWVASLFWYSWQQTSNQPPACDVLIDVDRVVVRTVINKDGFEKDDVPPTRVKMDAADDEPPAAKRDRLKDYSALLRNMLVCRYNQQAKTKLFF